MLRACLKPTSSRGPDDECATVTQGLVVYHECPLRGIEVFRLGVPKEENRVRALSLPFRFRIAVNAACRMSTVL